MRQTLLPFVLLVGLVVSLVPADGTAQPAKVGEEAQKTNLQVARAKAFASQTAKRGSYTVKSIPGVTDRTPKQLNGTRITPAELRDKKSKGKSLQPSPKAVAAAKLDPSFNLLDKVGSAFPVQDQGQCGSCWIFAAVSGHTASILFKNKDAAADLSEQYVFAEMFRESGKDPCGGGWPELPLKFLKTNGTFSRSLFPYSPTNPSQPPLRSDKAPFNASDYGYVGTGDASIPSIEEIKQAIATHGSVVSAVFAGDAFMHYEGGLFGTDDFPAGQINHAVTLIGWDDEPKEFKDDPGLRKGTGGGVWILRNSWNTSWGDNGNMKIAYNSSNIGYGAMWVDADGTPPPPPGPNGGDDKCPKPNGTTYQADIEKRIQFYEKNYKQYLPK